MKNHHRQFGFTLLELVVVMAIIAIFSSAAVPSIRDWLATARMESRAREFVMSVHMARAAARENMTVAGICAAASFSNCSRQNGLPDRDAGPMRNKSLHIAHLLNYSYSSASWAPSANASQSYGNGDWFLRAPASETAAMAQLASSSIRPRGLYGAYPFVFSSDGAYLGAGNNKLVQGGGRVYLCDTKFKRAAVIEVPEFGAARVERYIDAVDGNQGEIDQYKDGCQ